MYAVMVAAQTQVLAIGTDTQILAPWDTQTHPAIVG